MPITLDNLAKEIVTERTAVLFGAGSSIPSGAPAGSKLASLIKEKLHLEADDLSLVDIATLAELKRGRAALIETLRAVLKPLVPTGGLLNIPNYKWRDIFTTNFDQLIEKSYAKNRTPLSTISANYEFDKSFDEAQKLFKLHGTIEKDISDSDHSRLIISQEDYSLSDQYRENLYDRFLLNVAAADFLIIGYSLSDPDLNQIIDEAIRRKRASSSPGRIYVLSYTTNNNKALILEQRGLRVCFGSLDDFVAALDRNAGGVSAAIVSTDDPLSFFPHLRPNSLDVSHSLSLTQCDPVRMFHGSPPNYCDIANDFTFERDAISLIQNYMESEEAIIVYVLGVAGVGKTTLCRQFMVSASRRGHPCWEHMDGADFKAQLWAGVADRLKKTDKVGYLFVDNAHKYLREIGDLVDLLASRGNKNFRIVINSSVEQWNYRGKTPNIFALGRRIDVKRLSRAEIQRLLDLFDAQPSISRLVEQEFAGFSRAEKQRRLESRCESDFFVCLKNIFTNDLLDDIILKEYAGLRSEYQEIYRILAAYEASGVKLHRQAVIRALNIPAQAVQKILEDLDGILQESALNEKLGIYVWSGRHLVISDIIMRSKFSDESEVAELYGQFIQYANPTFDIERLNLMELCGRRGIGRIANRERQNHLYGMIISKAPTLRVPRHRLIDNLIRMGRYERAASEIRIFESDLQIDAPVFRFKVRLNLERSHHAGGLLPEDRISIVREGITLAKKGIDRFDQDAALHEEFCEAGIQYMRLTGDWGVADEAIDIFRQRSERSLDPDFARAFARSLLKVQKIQNGASLANKAKRAEGTEPTIS